MAANSCYFKKSRICDKIHFLNQQTTLFISVVFRVCSCVCNNTVISVINWYLYRFVVIMPSY